MQVAEQGRMTRAVVTAITPIPIAWLLLFVAIRTTRWVLRGRSI